MNTEILATGLMFPEAPRWHRGRLWFTDQHARRIIHVGLSGDVTVVAETADLPGGLGWQPDGTALVVHMTERRVMRLDGKTLRPFADLSRLASFHCNDMVVDDRGRALVGNFGFDLHGGAPRTPAELVLVEPDGTARIVARDLVFPNGCVIAPDGALLVVAETFAHRLTGFARSPDGSLGERRTWADLGHATPDGICMDAEESIWVACPGSGEVRRVREGGEITDRVRTRGQPYACILGGPSRRTLFVATSETDDPALARARRSGRIEFLEVSVPGAGLP